MGQTSNTSGEKLNPYHIWIVLIIAALLKLAVSAQHITPFNADEAIVALMARHINQGELPLFFYGQVYMGSLDAMLVSVGFKLLGEAVWVIRLVQSLLYLGTILSGMMLTLRLFHSPRTAFIAGLIMALPPVNVSLYTTVSLGGYGEILLIGNLLLLSGITILERFKSQQTLGPDHYLGLALWGLGAGFAFWVFGLSLIYSVPILILLIWAAIKNHPESLVLSILVLLAGGLIGASPWWSDIFRSGGFRVFTELAGGAIREAGTGPVLIRPLKRLVNLAVFGGTVIAGLRPPWDIRWLMLPLLPFVMIFWLVVLVHSLSDLNQDRRNHRKWLVSSIGFMLVIGFIFTPYGDDPSGRYFVPLITPMAIFASNLIAEILSKRQFLGGSILAALILFNLGGTVQSALKYPPGLSTQFDRIAQIDQRQMDDLIHFLGEEGIAAGYSNYWVSYPLAFQSGEELVFIPRLPYHEDFRYTARDDRYPPYGEVVEDADELAYITTNHPDLDEYIREAFLSLGIEWEENKIGDYQIFYHLSERVEAELLGLGVTTKP